MLKLKSGIDRIIFSIDNWKRLIGLGNGLNSEYIRKDFYNNLTSPEMINIGSKPCFFNVCEINNNRIRWIEDFEKSELSTRFFVSKNTIKGWYLIKYVFKENFFYEDYILINVEKRVRRRINYFWIRKYGFDELGIAVALHKEGERKEAIRLFPQIESFIKEKID